MYLIGKKLKDIMVEFAKLHPWLISLTIGLSMVNKLFDTVIIPKLLAGIFSSLNDKINMHKKIFLFLVGITISKISAESSNYVANQIEPALTSFLMTKFVQAILIKFENNHEPIEISVTLERIYSVKSAIEDLMFNTISKFIPVFIVIILALITVFKFNLKLGLTMCIMIVILIFVLFTMPRPINIVRKKDMMLMFIEDILKNIEFVSMTNNGLETAFIEMSDKIEWFRKKRIENLRRINNSQIAGYAIATVAYLITVYQLYRIFMAGMIKAEDFQSNILIIGKVYENVYSLSYDLPETYSDFQNILASVDFIDELFSYKEKEGYDENVDDGTIIFNDVNFKYDGYENIFTNLSLKFNDGDTVALYGASGSGKSSLVKLIIDTIRPDSGSVSVGGKDIKDISGNNIKKIISYQQQNTNSLFNRSVFDNMIFGIKDIGNSREKIKNILEEIDLESIPDIDEFLDKMITKGGLSLSGGQKQIIYLVRAILHKESKVIILDEPTSALDTTTKEKIIKLIKKIHVEEGKTLLIITHDPEIRNICDKVLSFESGRNPQIK